MRALNGLHFAQDREGNLEATYSQLLSLSGLVLFQTLPLVLLQLG